MYDSPQALAECLLAMSLQRMERTLAGLFQQGGLQAEQMARLHLMQMKRSVLDAQAPKAPAQPAQLAKAALASLSN